MRRPRVAESKRLLAEHGIDSASVSVTVLGEPESLREVTDVLDGLSDGLRPSAAAALARALTNGIAEAREAVGLYKSSAQALDSLHIAKPGRVWVRKLAIEKIADSPADSKTIIEKIANTCELLDAVEAYSVGVDSFESLEAAAEKAGEFLKVAQEYTSLMSREGLEDVHLAIAGKKMSEAIGIAQEELRKVVAERISLQGAISDLSAKLSRLGGSPESEAATVRELREQRERLAEQTKARQESLLSSFGPEVARIIQTLLERQIPSAESAGDDALGRALRAAVEGGYHFRLEAPGEDS